MGLSILIVEDDKTTNEALRLMVAKKFPSASIRSAANGSQGVELSRQQAADLVITDINMPGMDGIEMAEAIKGVRGDTRFIVLTGYSDEVHLNGFSSVGLSAYILKPIDFKKLFAAIEKCAAEIADSSIGQTEPGTGC